MALSTQQLTIIAKVATGHFASTESNRLFNTLFSIMKAQFGCVLSSEPLTRYFLQADIYITDNQAHNICTMLMIQDSTLVVPNDVGQKRFIAATFTDMPVRYDEIIQLYQGEHPKYGMQIDCVRFAFESKKQPAEADRGTISRKVQVYIDTRVCFFEYLQSRLNHGSYRFNLSRIKHFLKPLLVAEGLTQESISENFEFLRIERRKITTLVSTQNNRACGKRKVSYSGYEESSETRKTDSALLQTPPPILGCYSEHAATVEMQYSAQHNSQDSQLNQGAAIDELLAACATGVESTGDMQSNHSDDFDRGCLDILLAFIEGHNDFPPDPDYPCSAVDGLIGTCASGPESMSDVQSNGSDDFDNGNLEAMLDACVRKYNLST